MLEQNSKTSERINQLQYEKARIESEIAELSRKISSLKRNVDETDRENTNLEMQHDELRQELAELEDTLQRADTSIVAEETSLTTIQHQMQDLNKKVETKCQKLTEVKARVFAIENEKTSIEMRSIELEKEVEDFQAKSRIKEKELIELRRIQGARVSQKALLESKLAALVTQAREAEDDVGILEQEIKNESIKLASVAEKSYQAEEETEQAMRNSLKNIRDRSQQMLVKVQQNIERLHEIHMQASRAKSNYVSIDEDHRDADVQGQWTECISKLDIIVTSHRSGQQYLVETLGKLTSGLRVLEEKLSDADVEQNLLTDILSKKNTALTQELEKLDRIILTEKGISKVVDNLREQIRDDETAQKLAVDRITLVNQQITSLERHISELTEHLHVKGWREKNDSSMLNMSAGLVAINRQVAGVIEWLKKKKESVEKKHAHLLEEDQELDVNVEEAIKEEMSLMEDIERLESESADVKAQLDTKHAELNRIEGRIEARRIQFENLQDTIKDSQDTLLEVKDRVFKLIQQYGTLDSSAKKDFISSLPQQLNSMSMIEKTGMITFVGGIYENSLRLSTESTEHKSQTEIRSENHKEETILNSMSVVETIRNAIYSSVELTSEHRTRIEEVITRIKREITKGSLLSQSVQTRSDASGGHLSHSGTHEFEGKDWRNTLKHIANIVSYMMKTSSLLTNFAIIYSKRINLPQDRKTAVKARTVKFSEDIFERHRSMVQLIKSNENSQLASLHHLSSFSKRVSESGKEELGCQEDYLSSIVEIIGKD